MRQIGCRDPEDPLTRLRPEIRLGLDQPVQALQQLVQRRAQALRTGREDHAMGIADEKIVPEKASEPRQLSGECRLADSQAPAGGGHAAFGKQDIERNQKS
ncbi:MAG: hypothetical protein Tsb0019_10310 [Roseibium sp.]